MVSETRAIEIINKHLQCAQEASTRQYFPISASQIHGNGQLCEYLIDFLGDVYTYAGLDANYEENTCGGEIQEAINFLAFCNGKV
mgnify:CR=1 FL=1